MPPKGSRKRRILFDCLICGETFEKYLSSPKTYCGKECVAVAKSEYRRENNPAWKGGRYMRDGYWMVLTDEGYKLEHRVVMEKELGRALAVEEQVHHINENKLDNRPENLMVVSAAQHNAIHKRNQGNLYGSFTLLSCHVCGKRIRKHNTIIKNSRTGKFYCSVKCRGNGRGFDVHREV